MPSVPAFQLGFTQTKLEPLLICQQRIKASSRGAASSGNTSS